MSTEYFETAASFPEPLPAGVEFPQTIPNGYDPAGVSEPGVGESIAHFYWICAWQNEFIEAFEADDESAQEAALDMLIRWKATDFYTRSFEDPEDLWTRNMITPARSGEPQELIEGFENGCAYFEEHNQ